MPGESELYGALMQGQRRFSPIIFDDYAQLSETLVSAVLPYNLPGQIQLFFYQHHDTFQLIVLDEKGSLLRLVLDGRDEMIMLSVLNECLLRMLETRQLSDLSSAEGQDIKIGFNRLSKAKEGGFRVRAIKDVQPCAVNEIHVHVNNEYYESNVDLVFQGMEFSHLAYGEQKYEAMLHFARQQGVSERLPMMVSEVLISHADSQF